MFFLLRSADAECWLSVRADSLFLFPKIQALIELRLEIPAGPAAPFADCTAQPAAIKRGHDTFSTYSAGAGRHRFRPLSLPIHNIQNLSQCRTVVDFSGTAFPPVGIAIHFDKFLHTFLIGHVITPCHQNHGTVRPAP